MRFVGGDYKLYIINVTIYFIIKYKEYIYYKYKDKTKKANKKVPVKNPFRINRNSFIRVIKSLLSPSLYKNTFIL